MAAPILRLEVDGPYDLDGYPRWVNIWLMSEWPDREHNPCAVHIGQVHETDELTAVIRKVEKDSASLRWFACQTWGDDVWPDTLVHTPRLVKFLEHDVLGRFRAAVD